MARHDWLNAILMAVWRRRPKDQVLIHSDQGIQFDGDDWLRFCRDLQLEPSRPRQSGR